MRHDPRLNAAPRISDLSLDDRKKAMLARDREYRERFMEQYLAPKRPTLIERMRSAIGG